ncbi:MAG TPA: DUF2911 domain-containing protein [Opitutaceae bacterium]
MKFIKTVLALAALSFAASLSLNAQPAPRPSPHDVTSAVIGPRGSPRVIIFYGRPYSKDPKSGEIRKIWGGLVPFGKADRLGANEATTLLTSKPMVIGSTTIPAGAYTLYIVPSETGPSKLAFSKNIGKWGIPVDETQDVARVDLTKSTVDTRVDQLTIAVTNVPAGANGGQIAITWENTQYTVAFTLAN